MFLSSCSHVMLSIVGKVHLPWVIKEWHLIFETWFTMCVCGEIVWGSVSVNHTLFEGVKQSMKQEFWFNSTHKNTGDFFFFKWEVTLNLGTDTKSVCVFVSLYICALAYEFLPAQQTKSIETVWFLRRVRACDQSARQSNTGKPHLDPPRFLSKHRKAGRGSSWPGNAGKRWQSLCVFFCQSPSLCLIVAGLCRRLAK